MIIVIIIIIIITIVTYSLKISLQMQLSTEEMPKSDLVKQLECQVVTCDLPERKSNRFSVKFD